MANAYNEIKSKILHSPNKEVLLKEEVPLYYNGDPTKHFFGYAKWLFYSQREGIIADGQRCEQVNISYNDELLEKLNKLIDPESL